MTGRMNSGQYQSISACRNLSILLECLLSIGLQGCYYAQGPDEGPECGLRFVITPVSPR